MTRSANLIGLKSDIYMAASSANRQLFNPTVIKHNQYDGHIATTKQCGTHWIKYMLSHVLSQIHNTPPPSHVRDDTIIGHPKNPPLYKDGMPRLIITHSHPHYTMRSNALYNAFKTPPCAFVVRHPKDLLVSIYEKSKGEHIDQKYGRENVTFSEFLRTEINENHRLENIWGIIRFFNAWGAVHAACPDRTIMLRYEDIIKDTHGKLETLCNYFKIEGATPDILKTAVEKSSRSNMRKKLDTSEAQFERSINTEIRNFADWYSKEDNAVIDQICDRYLKHDFSYMS